MKRAMALLSLAILAFMPSFSTLAQAYESYLIQTGGTSGGHDDPGPPGDTPGRKGHKGGKKAHKGGKKSKKGSGDTSTTPPPK